MRSGAAGRRPRRALLVPVAFGAFGLGLGRTLAAIASHLLSAGWAVEVALRRELDAAAIARRFDIDLGGLEQARWPRRWGALPWPLRYRLGHLAFAHRTRRYDLVWVQSPYIPPVSLGRRSILFTEFPFDRRPRALMWRRRLRAYDRVVANSRFTSRWIERYWGVEAGVFYPSILRSRRGDKETRILGVGRFTAGRRSKHQLTLIETFRGMVDRGLRGWTLHLAGLREDEDYYRRAAEAVEGYPIDLHPDVDAAELSGLYGRAAIFWHATGLGVDAESEPSLLEHFGIVTAEAMSAGCVPVVFGEGGSPEVVGPAGFCWTDPAELAERTWQLIRDPELRTTLGESAEQRAEERFGKEAFARRLEALLS